MFRIYCRRFHREIEITSLQFNGKSLFITNFQFARLNILISSSLVKEKKEKGEGRERERMNISQHMIEIRYAIHDINICIFIYSNNAITNYELGNRKVNHKC